jgi:hypothetical protein
MESPRNLRWRDRGVLALPLILAFSALSWGCATATTEVPAPAAAAPEAVEGLVGEVSVQPWTFNPSIGQEVAITYELAEPARVTVTVYGPNRERTATVVDGEPRDAGRHRETWDGRDDGGIVVPDEAYFPVVEAESDRGPGRYDPLAHSGGERVNPADIHFNSRDGLISYVLPKASRVLVRAGLDEGPMLATLVNWEPRGPGLSTERWKGRDQQGVRSFIRHPDALVIIQPYALPESSILTVGNREESYREAYLARGEDRPKKAPAARQSWLDDIASPHWGQPAHLDKDPEIAVTFPELEPGPATLADHSRPLELRGDRVIVRVEVPDEPSRRFLREQRFELVAFLDDERIDEAEQAHLPFNWSWEIAGVEPGEHLLTINLVTFRQHVGVSTRRVRIVR